LVADLAPSKLAQLDGSERFSAGDASVLDFWRWALGDLRMNTARGYLAEFLVARALSSPDPTRVEWAAHDVRTADGTRIEVKSSGYLQSWGQRQRSPPRWGLTGAKLAWNVGSGSYEDDPAGRVDVWVFAMQACADPSAYDPLDINQWRWWAMPNTTVERCGQKTAGISTIERLAGQPVHWDQLERAVAVAAGTQTDDAPNSRSQV
jgi:hypothetical protein